MVDVPGAVEGAASGRPRRTVWSGLGTADGFERCVRGTAADVHLRAALLVGPDRAEAERRVVAVYRSLGRAVRSGETDEVTTSALRNAVVHRWLTDHADDLAAVGSLRTGPVPTIGDLSLLERAVVVMRHVCGWPAERTARELGRSTGHVGLVESNAVRRLRGVDDISGSWVRAYVGAEATIAPDVVDRVLAAVALDAASVVTPDRNDSAPAPVGPEPAGPRPTGPRTTEPRTTEPRTTGPGPTGPEPRPTGGTAGDDGDGLPDDAPVERPRWVVAVGGVLVLALAGALVALVIGGDRDETIVAVPVEATSVPPTVPTTEPSTAASVVPSSAPSTLPTGTGAGCDGPPGAAPPTVDLGASFGALGDGPALTVRSSAPSDAAVTASLLPDGLLVALTADGSTVGRIGLDGSTVWTRCFAAAVETRSVREAGVDVAVRPVGGSGAWTVLSWADGSEVGAADPVQASALEVPVAFADPVESSESDDGPRLGGSYDSESGRAVLAGVLDGVTIWTAPDVVSPEDGFRSAVDAGVVVARSCPTADCADGRLVGLDLATGEQRWERAGDHHVAVLADGLALVGDASGWSLLDVTTGTLVGGWDDTGAFPQPADVAEGARIERLGGSLLVTWPDRTDVWLPAGAGPSPTPADVTFGTD